MDKGQYFKVRSAIKIRIKKRMQRLHNSKGVVRGELSGTDFTMLRAYTLEDKIIRALINKYYSASIILPRSDI